MVCTYDSGSSSRGSTVERVVDLQSEDGRTDEETPRGHTNENSSYGAGHHSMSNYPATSEQYSSHSYYAPAQTSTSYWPEQGQQNWNSQYVTTTSSAYDASYYGSAGVPAAGTTYDTNYYSNTYTGYTTQDDYFSAVGDPRAFVGSGTTYDALNDLPADSSRRNAELYHFFHRSLAPYLVTIDGKDPPASFYNVWTPWIVQSPLLATIPLLNASCYLSNERGLEVAKSSETITLQSRIISVINGYLRKKKMKEVDTDAVAAVFYLAMNEWYWGDDGSFWAHMKGLKEIIRLRGGFDSMEPDSLLRKQLVLADYQIAAAFEHELFLHEDPNHDASLISLASYPTFLESPLLPSGIRFLDIFGTFSLSVSIAEILDDMKSLTSSIRTFQTSRNPPTAEDLAKFKSSTLWTHNRILSLPSQLPSSDPTSDLIYESVRLTSLIYSFSILSVTPLSKSHTPGQIVDLHDRVWKVSLSRWKQMPGVILWIVLVVAAAGGETEKREKKFAERMIHTVAMFIGLQSQEVAVSQMRAFLGVQRWVGGRDERAYEGVGKGKETAFSISALEDDEKGGGPSETLGEGVGLESLSRGELNLPRETIAGIAKRDDVAIDSSRIPDNEL